MDKHTFIQQRFGLAAAGNRFKQTAPKYVLPVQSTLVPRVEPKSRTVDAYAQSEVVELEVQQQVLQIDISQQINQVIEAAIVNDKF
jgi:uncharacterized Zn finger protein (UPF0148 family)